MIIHEFPYFGTIRQQELQLQRGHWRIGGALAIARIRCDLFHRNIKIQGQYSSITNFSFHRECVRTGA